MARTYNQPNTWPQQDVDKLSSLAAQGYSAGQIAHALSGQYSRSAVIGKCYRLGLALLGNESKIARIPVQCEQRGQNHSKQKFKEADKITPIADEQEFIGPIGEYPSLKQCQYEKEHGHSFQCCGQPSTRNKFGHPTPYCEYHRTIMYQPLRPRASSNPASVQLSGTASAP